MSTQSASMLAPVDSVDEVGYMRANGGNRVEGTGEGDGEERGEGEGKKAGAHLGDATLEGRA